MANTIESGSEAEPIEALVDALLEASRRHDAKACASLFAEDAVLLSPYGPIARGREAIEATHRSWFAEGETNKRLDILETRLSGDTGYCMLAYAGDYVQPDGSVVTERGVSLNALARTERGDWIIRVSSLNGDDG